MATTNSDPGAVIESGTPLTRNHWFDGKLLRADDLARDQDYHRAALRLANQAGGFGIVHGLELSLSGAELQLQPGLAVAPNGDLLLLHGELSVGIEALLAAGSALALRLTGEGASEFQPCVLLEPADSAVPIPTEGLRVYRLTLEINQALCGFEDVVGSLCERACVSERQRPYQLEGVRLRAQRVTLNLPALAGIESAHKHLRSRIASLLFARDDAALAPLPDDGGRLQSPLWCSGAELASGRTVTLGYLVRQSGQADFIELWSGRRERMQAQALGYWQRRTRLRPFADFIAQVAQFQCQLARSLDPAPAPTPGDEGGSDCDTLRSLVAALKAQIDAEPVSEVSAADKLSAVDTVASASSPRLMQRLSQFSRIVAPLLLKRVDRLLIDRGIIELPPAGFLPVHGDSALQTQVQNLVGPGVQLRFCTAPLDAIGHLFEQAQHSARTALTPGLADATKKPLLQVIVPDGQWQDATVPGFELTAYLPASRLAVLWLAAAKLSGVYTNRLLAPNADSMAATLRESLLNLSGTASDRPVVGQGAGRIASVQPGRLAMALVGQPEDQEFAAEWLECLAADDPFAAAAGSRLALDFDIASLASLADTGAAQGDELHFKGALQLDADADAVLVRRAEIESVTGVAGGELRGARVEGEFSFQPHVHGAPQQGDDPDSGVAKAHAAEVILQRVRESTGLRWLLIKPMPGEGELTSYLVFDLQAPDASTARALELRRVERQAPLEKPAIVTVALTATLARFRPDAQALAAGAAPRTRAESALKLLDQHLPDIAPDAAARQRLFGSGGSGSGLSGPHDWLLFRRPVDAQCTVAPPPPVVAAPPPPVKTSLYRAAVARFLPGATAAARKQALEAISQGLLPSEATARLSNAGTLSYVGSAALPDATDSYLVAQLGRAGFAPPCRLVGVFSADAGSAPLLLERAQKLGRKLGAEPQQGLVLTQTPIALRAGEDGVMLFAVDPEELPAPAPQIIHYRQRVMLLSKAGSAQLNQLLIGMMWENQAEALIKRLSNADLSRGLFEFEAELQFSPDSVKLLDGTGSGLQALITAVQASNGISDQFTTLLRAADDNSDNRSRAEAAGQALFQRLAAAQGAQVRVIGCNPAPGELVAPYDAFTVLLGRG